MNLIKQIYLFFFMLFISNSSLAFELDNYFKEEPVIKFKFGGWSYHNPVGEDHDKPPINENHRGVGFEYYKELKDYDNHFLGLGAWYMEDSFFMDSIYLAAAYEYKIPFDDDFIFDSIDFNLNAGVSSRSKRTLVYYVTYDRNGNLTSREYGYHEDNREFIFTTMPIVSLNFTKNLHADFTYVPEFLAESFGGGYELFFFRLGYTL